VCGEVAEYRWQPGIPLVPVMASANGVKFKAESALCEQIRKLAIWWKESLLLSAGQEKERRRRRVRGTS
jgi:hypothetical protein